MAARKDIRIEILEYSYWEHFKAAKDISLVLPIEHYKRKSLESTLNSIQVELSRLKK